MIEADHTFAGDLVTRLIAGPGLGSAFRRVRIHGQPEPPGAPLLLVANHFSWWDGFIQYRLGRALLGRRLYAMMDERQWLAHPLLRHCGCFPVRKHSREALRALDYAAALLADARNAVVLFPQGRIESMHMRPIRFERGAEYLCDKACGLRIGFNANLVDYFSAARPSLDIYYESFPAQALAGKVEAAFNEFYRSAVERQGR